MCTGDVEHQRGAKEAVGDDAPPVLLCHSAARERAGGSVDVGSGTQVSSLQFVSLTLA